MVTVRGELSGATAQWLQGGIEDAGGFLVTRWVTVRHTIAAGEAPLTLRSRSGG
jgi:hypothetical protein